MGAVSSTTATVLNQTGLDYRDLALDDFLANLQGNILKGHGRDNTVHIFVRFGDDRARTKAWLRSFAEDRITSFKEQLRQRELFKRNGKPGALFAGIYFSKVFYEYLNLDINQFDDAPFKAGMKSRRAVLSDIPSEHWERTYQHDLHAMILLAHDDAVELGEQTRAVCDELVNPDAPEQNIAVAIDMEYGSAIRNANGDGLEHFGYVDGISQPLFLKDEIDAYNSQNLQPLRFDAAAKPNLVLVSDPFASETDTFGSYFVFRKLEQHVRGFKEAEQRVADALNLDGEDRERAGAMIVGRFEDGTPVTLSKEDHMISSGIMNNFDYKETTQGTADDQGARCPFHGHIRKANPRRNDADKTHIMARRGITYGHRNVSTTIEQTFVQMPKSGVGLLFMSFQKSIEDQFEFIQRNWVNNIDFPQAGTGVDVIIGQGSDNRNGNYAATYNDPASLQQVAFRNFVTLKGGDYFFAPSIPFLESLS